ncbi:MAG: hypothetical protein ABFD16_00140 [Thermoguttaceae bacterium]
MNAPLVSPFTANHSSCDMSRRSKGRVSWATSYPKAGRPTNWGAVRQAASLVEEARAVGLPVDILRLSNRGYLRPGSVADVVVL